MSSRPRHGPPPPGDPYGYPPRDPYGRPPPEPVPGYPAGAGDYRPPSDPWGQATEHWDHEPRTWPDPAPGYRQPRHSGTEYPGAPPPRRNYGLYAAVAVLVVLAATGVGYALFLLTGDANPEAGQSPGPTATGTATATPDPSAPPADRIGLSAAVAAVDDCLVNDGTDEETQMRIVACDGTDEQRVIYRVLTVIDQRVEGEDEDARHASAQAICADIEAYTHHYFEAGDPDSFVLCMAELE